MLDAEEVLLKEFTEDNLHNTTIAETVYILQQTPQTLCDFYVSPKQARMERSGEM